MIEPELMCHVSVLVNWKHFLFHRGCEKDDRLVFSLASIRGATRLKKNSKVTCRSQAKTTKLNGKALRMPCIGYSWTDHKKDMTFWQAKTHAIIAHMTVISER